MQHKITAVLVAKTFYIDGTEAPREEVLRYFKDALDGLEFQVEVEDGDDVAYQIRVESFEAE